jgi:IclR family acetate operon transcriptional repressor
MGETDHGGVRDGMQSVLRSLDSLEAISRMQPVGLSDLARQVGLPKTTVARILRTLDTAGWISADSAHGDPRWLLTPRAFAIGATLSSSVDLRDVARGIIESLGSATDENIHLSKPDQDSMVLIERVASSRAVQTVANIGDRAPMHLSASGWAYLAALPRADAERVLPKKLAAFTDLSIVDRKQLLSNIREVGEAGYAINPGRWRRDVAAIGAAITGGDGLPIAALSISMPSYRFNEETAHRYGELVKAAADAISREFSRLTRGGAAGAVGRAEPSAG